MSVTIYDVIKSPLVTERTSILKEKFNQYTFRVDPRASKSDVKRAIQSLFNVQVKSVRTSMLHGKFRRMAAGRPQGQRSDWKKAIVTLKPGQEIKLDQEV